jgi:hypothetical protein
MDPLAGLVKIGGGISKYPPFAFCETEASSFRQYLINQMDIQRKLARG